MKKILSILLLALVLALVFAEDAETVSGSGSSILDSVGLNVSFGHASIRGKYDSSDIVRNSILGVGVGLTAEFDLSEIPNFFKDGWYGYADLDFIFSDKIVLIGNRLTKADASSMFAFKSHLGVLRSIDLGIPFETRLGIGVSFNELSAKGDSNFVTYASSVGVAALGECSLNMGDHLALSLTAILGMNLSTSIYNKERYSSGLVSIKKRDSLGLGLDASVKLGVRYII